FPSQIVPVIGVGLFISLFLMLVARPLSVFLCLMFNKVGLKEKTFISWVGLRGAVPIILATFPLIAGVPKADVIFNMVFFIVLTSILFQGTTVPVLAKILKLDEQKGNKRIYPIAFEHTADIDASLEEIIVPYHSSAL